MSNTTQPYTAGDWTVKSGEEASFIERWTALTEWSAHNAPGAQGFLLLQALDDPRHFVSTGQWRDLDSVQAWRARPEFQELYARCHELCENLASGLFTVSAAVYPRD